MLLKKLVGIFFTVIWISSSFLLAQDSVDEMEFPTELLEALKDSSTNGSDSSNDSEASKSFESLWERIELATDLQGALNSVRKDTPLNPNNALISYGHSSIKARIDLILNPKLTGQLTLRTRSIITYAHEWLSTGANESFDRYFMEGYLQWINNGRTIVLDAGKQKLDWGVSSGWTPVNLLIPLPQVNNRYNEDLENEGLGMIHMEYSNTVFTLNGVIAQLKTAEDDSGNLRQGAFKWAAKVDPFEMGWVHHEAKSTAPVNGIYFSGLLTDLLEVHGEWTRTTDRNRKMITKVFDGYTDGSGYIPTYYTLEDDDRDKNFDKVVIGGKYTFSNDSSLTLEYYYTGHGYSESEWDEIKNGIKEANTSDAWKNDNFNASEGNRYSGYLYSINELLRDTRNKKNYDLRKNYLFAHFYSGESDDIWEWTYVLKLNLDDSSQTHSSILNKSWSDHLNTELTAIFYCGAKHSEYGLSPYQNIVSLSAKLLF